MDEVVHLFGPFILATAIGLFIAFLTWYAARKSGLNPAQASLIDTLQDNAMALNEQVRLLREELDAERKLRQALERKVHRLETVVIDLASENGDLRRKLGMPVKRNVLDDLENMP